VNSVDYLRSLLSQTPVGKAIDSRPEHADEAWFQLHELLRGERHMWLEKAAKLSEGMTDSYDAVDIPDAIRALKTEGLGR
jgi:hypothetical protein